MCNVKTCIRCGKEKGEDSFTRLKYRNGRVHEKRILTTCLQCLDEAKAKRASTEKEFERNGVQPCLYCGKSTKVNKKKKYCSRTCGRYATGQLKEWDKSPRNCKQCGTLFTPKSKAHSCCSHSCQYSYSRENYQHKHTEKKSCVICGEGYIPKNSVHVTCSKKCSDKLSKQRVLAKVKPVLCVTCGKEWQPLSLPDPKQGRLHKYCSFACRNNSEEWRSKTIGKPRPKQWLTSGTKYKAYYPVYFTECRQCNTLFTARFKTTGLCSKECGRLDALRVAREIYKADYVPTEITCKECGKHHITQFGEKLKGFCSSKCSKKHGKRIQSQKRRARMKGVEVESINPNLVFKRDQWACRICGIKTPKKLQGTNDPNAPSLDHIIPIAKGGPHIYENVQCACRKCNSYKSDKMIGQIPLFLYSNTA
jgi:hypothetical protein